MQTLRCFRKQCDIWLYCMVILSVVGPVDCVSPTYGLYRRVGIRLYEVTDRHHTGILQELYAALSRRAQELCVKVEVDVLGSRP